MPTSGVSSSVTNSGTRCPATRCTSRCFCTCSTSWARSAGYRPVGSESAREAARSYKKRIDESSDPLVNAVRGLGSTVGSAADSIFEWLSRRARGGVQDTTQPGADESAAPSDQDSGDGDQPGTSAE